MPKKEDFILKHQNTLSTPKKEFTPKKRAPYLMQEERVTQTITSSSTEILEIDPSSIDRWEYKDRPSNEMGNIDSLAKEFIEFGQQQPCLVRKKGNNRYELIIGERRWNAAKKANVNLKAIVTSMSNYDAAIAQIAENDSRHDLSDYAKGMSLFHLIEKGIIEQKDLIQKLGKTKQYISAILSFAKIPPEIIDAIGDMSKVSAKTAERIKQLSSKGDDYIDKIIKYAPQIAEGKVGSKKLPELISKSFHKAEKHSEKFYKNGKHVGTIRLDNNSAPSYHFPKALIDHINTMGISTNEVGELIADLIDRISNEGVPSRGQNRGS